MKFYKLKEKLFPCFLLLLILFMYYFFRIPCPIQWLTSIPCPGCGMTRAYTALLHLDFSEAFRMHPMFWSIPVLLVYYFKDFRLFKQKWLNNGILILIGAGFLIQWIIKVILHFAA